MIGRFIVALVLFLARHDPVPARWDKWAAVAAMAAIGFYQRHLSRWSGRCCLFRTSCSSRALIAFGDEGWRGGLRTTAAQLSRCGGAFTLIRTVQGESLLISNDGIRFPSSELSDQLRGISNEAS